MTTMHSLLFLIMISTSSCTSITTGPMEFNKGELKVAVVNYKVTGGKSLAEQMGRIENFARAAKAKGAAYLLLPELMIFDLLSPRPDDKTIMNELETIALNFLPYENSLKAIAIKHGLTLIGASVIIKTENGLLNRAFYINSQGTARYQDKVYPTPWERKYGIVGGEKIKLFQDDRLSFVILICHDAEFPAISHSLATLRPEIIFVPSQTDDLSGLERVRTTSAARAIEHFSYVLMTGTSGDKEAPWHSYVGENFLFTPQNKYFLIKKKPEGNPHQEGLSIFSINLKLLRESRNDKKQIYPARDQNDQMPLASKGP